MAGFTSPVEFKISIEVDSLAALLATPDSLLADGRGAILPPETDRRQGG